MLRRPVAVLAAAVTVTLVACGGDDDAGSGATGSNGVTDVSLVPASPPSLPDVEIPNSIPTELVVTELRPGEGDEAVEGQIVVVDYVGVRSETGEQFDTSYGRGPLAVAIGAGRVIPGWDQGLVGSQVGQRLQLDIPADLAYGAEPPGDPIQPGDALTFVIDVRTIVPGGPPADADLPTSSIPVDAPTTDDVRAGTGAALELGDTGLFHLVAARADDGTVLTSSWVDGQAQPLVVDEAQLPPGLADSLVGMQVGGRRVIIVPYSADLQLTPETDLVIVADLLATY